MLVKGLYIDLTSPFARYPFKKSTGDRRTIRETGLHANNFVAWKATAPSQLL